MQELETTLQSQIKMPLLGFGTWHLTGTEGRAAIQEALATGYCHLDTADRYGNHREVAAALQESGLQRDEVFITSKVWRDDLHYEDVTNAAERFLNELDTTYIDLLLIHWPNSSIPLAETLDALNELKRNGKIRAIGVSNFTVAHLQEAAEIGTQIDVNQVEFHPSLNQKALKQYCDARGIVLTAYSPTAQGADLELPVIRELAEQYGKTPAQIIINWLLRKGIAAIPRSGNPEHIRENFAAATFALSEEDVEKIDAHWPAGNRILNPTFAEFDRSST
jgi:diketogulonate reductase-like aldo/keto reductase